MRCAKKYLDDVQVAARRLHASITNKRDQDDGCNQQRCHGDDNSE